jgi:hypothetical protein
MIQLRTIPPSLQLAAAALLLSCVFVAWSVAGATRPAPVEARAPSSTPRVRVLGEMSPTRNAEISRAVDVDPFSPTRTRPAVRYKLADEVDVPVTTGRAARQPLRWGGVIYSAADPSMNRLSVAMGTNANAPVQSLKVGEKIGDYTLKSFDYKSATFISASGEQLVIANPRKGIK